MRPAQPWFRAPKVMAVLGLGVAVVALGLFATSKAMSRATSSADRSATASAPAQQSVAADTTRRATLDSLSWADGLALGAVEGITEYLPISSTGHLVVTERFLDLDPPKGPARDALNSYTVVIQIGAILAVLLLYRHRVVQIVAGVGRHNPTGRRLLIAIFIAFVPAGLMAKTFEGPIEDRLLEPAPVAVAWLVGGIALTLGASWLRKRGETGRRIEEITMQQAAIIAVAQILALWPGVSRSLVTIVGAVIAGLTIGAAVEFSFLLGLATLSAATLYELTTNGSQIIDQFGIGAPLVGILAAFVAAAAAIKLFVDYLNRHDLRIFGVFRIVIGLGTLALLATDVI